MGQTGPWKMNRYQGDPNKMVLGKAAVRKRLPACHTTGISN